MSYQVIARRWRPQSFDEVTGQSHVTTPLRNAIRTGRVPHAVLLTGPRGVGKTTLARILARCLNCEKGPTDTPCGTCATCLDISAGTSTDVREIDAASRTGVDDVREVIEAVRYAPSPGKHRIFVIDEVHMLSTAAFNALLKTLEEPPPHSLFVFATTNPEKIPFTVLSRCQRYDLRLFSNAEVAERLAEICRAEDIEISDESLRAVAREGQGSMRDSQTLLDQLVAYGGNAVSDDTVRSLLDLVDRHVLLEIVEACIDRDPARVLDASHRAAQSGTEPDRIASALIALLRDLVVMRVAPDAEGLVEGGEAELSSLRALAERAEPARLRRMFAALNKETASIGLAPHPFAVLEMALVRLATLPTGDDVQALLGRIDQLERHLGAGPTSGGSRGGGGSGGGGGTGGAGPRRSRAPEPPSPGDTRSRPRSESPTLAEPAPSRGPVASAAVDPVRSEPAVPVHEPPTPVPAAEVAPSPVTPLGQDAPLAVVLDRLRVFAQDENRGLFASLDDAELVARQDDALVLRVASSFHRRRLQDRIAELAETCARFFGRATRVEIVAPEPRQGPTRGADPTRRREDERRRRQEALEHPKVNIAVQALQAEIIEIRTLGD